MTHSAAVMTRESASFEDRGQRLPLSRFLSGDSVKTHMVLVLCVALFARVGVAWYVVTHMPLQWFYSRGLEMGLLADSVARGDGLSSPFGVGLSGPTAMIAPGYPVFVAGIFHVFGSYTRASLVTILGVQVLLNLVTVWLILDLGRRVAKERWSVLAGLLWACSPPLLWMSTIFWETSFSACLLLGSIALGLRLQHSVRRRGWALYGCFCALGGLINPALLPTLLFVGVWSVRPVRSRRWSRLALMLLSFGLVYSPWPMRNARVFHAWIPTRTTVGFELWMGNRAGASGYLDESLFPTFNPAELARYRSRGELGYFREKEDLAFGWMRANPGRSVQLTLLRVQRFWAGSGNRHGSIVFIAHAVLTTLLGFTGMVGLLRSGDRRMAPLLLFPLLLFPVPYYLTHAEFRYRLDLDPVLTVLAAAGLERCLSGRERRRSMA